MGEWEWTRKGDATKSFDGNYRKHFFVLVFFHIAKRKRRNKTNQAIPISSSQEWQTSDQIFHFDWLGYFVWCFAGFLFFCSIRAQFFWGGSVLGSKWKSNQMRRRFHFEHIKFSIDRVDVNGMMDWFRSGSEWKELFSGKASWRPRQVEDMTERDWRVKSWNE